MFRFTIRDVLWLTVVVACSGIGIAFARKVRAVDREREQLVKAIFISDANYKIVMTANRVTACELSSDSLFTRPPGAKATYAEGKAIDLQPTLLAALREELGRPGAYVLGSDKNRRAADGCIPNYGVRFHFTTDSQSLDVNFCFGCGDIALSRGEKIFHEAKFRKDAKFLDLCVDLFPDNQKLKERKSQQ